MSDKLSAVLSDVARGPHRRYVWTLTANPSRNQHPSLRSNYNPKTIHDLFFRTEVQTTVPLGDNVHALFAVDVKMTALADLWDDTSKKNAILESIQSMSNNMLHYKNLNDIKLIIEKAK